MKKFITTAVIGLLFMSSAMAQDDMPTVQGTTYFLPKTALRFSILAEKKTYTPGEYAKYAEKYLRKMDVSLEPETTYRILNVNISSFGMPDSTKQYVAKNDAKHSISTLQRDENGVLLAVNTTNTRTTTEPEAFKPANKVKPLNPRDFMNEEILSAGSTVKMAELCACEIYDIRENKSLLNKGQADFMPKDGEQLRIMLENLNTQEAALLQLFDGTTQTDTIEKIITFIPSKETGKQVLFRFSSKLGFTDADDLAGRPYYIDTEDLHVMPVIKTTIEDIKKEKEDSGICVNLPGKIRVTLYKGTDVWAAYELYAAQYGMVEALNSNMFSKKFTTNLILNPVTGNVESINTEMIKK
ncbi:DUF4831 family protein [Xylanibacter caecicola]|uniref:DUF4831 family protein n=1 Tax=Xylanibacter caecicola TaxID=2736294 RepID=UPI0025832756|nr:DUF4831 family protein [Xylanibacter caecicola]